MTPRLLVLVLLIVPTGCSGRSTSAPSPAPTVTVMAARQAAIAVSPQAGGAGVPVTVTGTGYPPGTLVIVHLGPRSSGTARESYGEGTADATGQVVIAFTLPERWPSGQLITDEALVVIATSADGTVSAATGFEYVPSAAALAPAVSPLATPGARPSAGISPVATPAARLTIQAQVAEIAVSARIIGLVRPIQGRASVVVNDRTTISQQGGQVKTLADIKPGMTIQATGLAGGSDTLLADSVVVLTAGQ